MGKIILILVLLMSVKMFGLDTQEGDSIRIIPILEVNGDEMPSSEREIIERYGDEFRKALPVVFRGAAKTWEIADWTPEYFAERFGDQAITVADRDLVEKSNYYNEDDQFSSRSSMTTMREHINEVRLNPSNAGYLTCNLNSNMTEQIYMNINFQESFNFDKDDMLAYTQLGFDSLTKFPKLNPFMADYVAKKAHYSLPIEPDNKMNWFSHYTLFIGGHSITTLHNHGQNFLAQIYGTKLAILIHPKYIEKCYCQNHIGQIYVFKCAIDIMNPDFEKYPDLENIEIYQTILEPGDILYIPRLWLHDIRSLSASISLFKGY